MLKLLAMRKFLRRLIRNERGAALVEYGMLVGLIAAICILAVTNLGTRIQAVFQAIHTALAPLAP